jgi:hypothetical protein
MKNILLYASVATLLGGMVAAGQENPSSTLLEAVNFPVQLTAYSPDSIRTVGTLNSGQTSKSVEYSRTPEYRALVFEGHGYDQVEITVVGTDKNAFVALADSTLAPIAHSSGKLVATLPYHGPDVEAFYILFKAKTSQPTRLAVHLKQIPAAAQPADATR